MEQFKASILMNLSSCSCICIQTDCCSYHFAFCLALSVLCHL